MPRLLIGSLGAGRKDRPQTPPTWPPRQAWAPTGSSLATSDFPPTITKIQVTYSADLAGPDDGDISTVKGMFDELVHRGRGPVIWPTSSRSATCRAHTAREAKSHSAFTSPAASPTPRQPPAK